MRYIFFILLLFFSTTTLYAQETLNVTKNTACEVFPEKGKFDAQERLRKIKELGGQLVTVYSVKGKENRIKAKYTGRVDIRSIDDSKLPLDTRTRALVVAVNQGNGKMIYFISLTDDKNYRIYLADCLGQ